MGFSHSDDRERSVRNLANPGATTNCFSDNLTVNGKAPVVRVTVVPATTSVVLIQEVLGAATFTFNLNGGTTVTADSIASFDVPAVSGASYNVQFATNQTGNGAVIKKVHMMQLEA